MTRPLYRYVEDAESSRGSRRRARSHSVTISRPEPEDAALDINRIKVPGGFRRNYLWTRRAASPSGTRDTQPGWIADNFIEFLTIYGHFAGEQLDEEDDEESDLWSSDEANATDAEEGRGRRTYQDDGGDEDRGGANEDTNLLPARRGRKKPKSTTPQGTAGSGKAVLLLLKSFVGTGYVRASMILVNIC